MKVIVLIVCLAILATESVYAQEEVRTARTGAAFARDKSLPSLGEAWRDPSGTVWGDLAQSENHIILSLEQCGAEAYCKSIGARLPTGEELIRLSEYLGGVRNPNPDWWNYVVDVTNYLPEVLPNLNTDAYKDQGRFIWSSSATGSGRYVGFFGSSGEVVGISPATWPNRFISTVRCVK